MLMYYNGFTDNLFVEEKAFYDRSESDRICLILDSISLQTTKPLFHQKTIKG